LSGSAYSLLAEDRARFAEDGYFFARGLFSAEEVSLLDEVTRLILPDDQSRLDRHDAAGNLTLLSLRNELADDIFSATVQCERVARTMEALLGDEVYHYHHKVMIKEAVVGGAWEWHQDYGYWYQNGCLRPDMASCLVAITRADQENGCLEVVRGSHRLGRIDHIKVDDQVCAEPARVREILKRMEVDMCEMEPGDGLFFHANVLHRSRMNTSPVPRLSLINCYNTRTNDPYMEHHHPCYSPLEVEADEVVLSVGRRQLADLGGKPS
jgi:ectoine hydroxylase-related dioxygenase (phytanoyl-CoA dioxygenase family)